MSEINARTGALRVMQAGAIAIVLAAAPYKLFELDRYFVPKELALHVTALALVIACARGARRLSLTRVETLLGLFLLLGIASAVAAPNHWVAARAIGITFSGLVIFRGGRAIAGAGGRQQLLGWLTIAVVLASITSLLQAYGVDSEYFSLNRSPGGTFGNRNFIAHLAAIGLPVLIVLIVNARRWGEALAGSAGVGILAAAIVLSRSRAAMLAVAAGVLVLGAGIWLAHRRWHDSRIARRLPLAAAFALAGVAAAVLLPNSLNWNSDSPYLDTVTGVVNYHEGSGHGRLVQYATSLKLAAAHPLLGVGPGNWAVAYPRVAAPDDPSLDHDDGMTANPWPSSDWIAMLAERGVPACIALALAMGGLALLAAGAIRRATRLEELLLPLALVATLGATVVVGAFDASLLLAPPTLFVWAFLGALATPAATRMTLPIYTATAPGLALVGGAAVLAFALAARSAAQLGSMAMFTSATTVGAYSRAALADPGSYRIHLRLAQIGVARGRCDLVKSHARSAHELFPAAAEPRRMLRGCGVRVRRR
jgi:O-antigen ligase